MKHSTFFAAAFFALALSACVPSDTQTPDSEKPLPYTLNESMPAGSFGHTGSGIYAGDLTVRGYATIEEVNEPFCMENCRTFDYLMFHVTETGNRGLADFLGLNEGNAYAGEASIGLGCNLEGMIHYANHSDELQMEEFTLSPETSAPILASSEENQVSLLLHKLPLRGGTQAPACYSHFTSINISL